jgi:ABC-type nickel/cobalt efflux system permease component RcnA
MTTMAFGVLFVLLLAVSGWWLYSRWAEVRDAQQRRREAEMLYVFQAKRATPAPQDAAHEAPAAGGDFSATLPRHP